MNPDAINAAFEGGGALLLTFNIRQVARDQRLSGVHWAPTAFFTVWGVWNLFFYPHLHQWLSFCGGLAIVVVNAAWLALVAKFAFRRALPHANKAS